MYCLGCPSCSRTCVGVLLNFTSDSRFREWLRSMLREHGGPLLDAFRSKYPERYHGSCFLLATLILLIILQLCYSLLLHVLRTNNVSTYFTIG